MFTSNFLRYFIHRSNNSKALFKKIMIFIPDVDPHLYNKSAVLVL
jgi:hypothetical protein